MPSPGCGSERPSCSSSPMLGVGNNGCSPWTTARGHRNPAAAVGEVTLSLTLVIGCTPGAIASPEPDFFVFLLLISGERAVLGCKALGLAPTAGS